MARTRRDTGKGPPPGSSSDSARAPKIPLKNPGDTMGKSSPDGYARGDGRSDGAARPPTDPLAAPDTRGRARLVYRDIPLVTIQNTWSVQDTRSALYAHMIGQFDFSGQLCDAIMGDDRVMATLGSRISGLFGREVRFTPADDSDAAKEVLDAWVAHWPMLSGDGALYELAAYTIMAGFSQAQLVWDTSGPVWRPFLRPWHMRYEYYHWEWRRYVALTQGENIPIVPGDAKWFLHAPHGEYRGWIRGAIRAVAEPWLLRHFAFRDMARFSEVHGMPTRIGETPAAADPGERAQFEEDLSNLGSETTLLIGKGVDEQNSYGYRLVEATDTAWESFPGLMDRADMAIVLGILFQNLTTEVKGGSFAATSAHMDVRQSGLQFDGMGWSNALYTQVARPFAFLNFGDANLAPKTAWDVAPREDYDYQAKQFQAFGTAVEVLRRGGVQFKDVGELRRFAARRFGLDGLPDFDITEPVASGGGMGK